MNNEHDEISNKEIETIVGDVVLDPDASVQSPVATRDARGRFVKGVSGNPQGKAVGTRNRATLLRESIDEALLDEITEGGEFIKVLEAVLRKAKEGDIQAAKLILKDIAALRDDKSKGSGGKFIQVNIENFTKQEVIEHGD